MKWLLTFLLASVSVFAQVAGSTGERGIPPTISLPSITTTSPLPTGTANSVYNNVTMSVSGGASPFTWSVTAGALPTGLSLSSAGVISGTPTTAQTTTPTIQVSDNNAHTDSKVFSITINAASSGCAAYAANRTISTGDPTQIPPSGSKLTVSDAYCLNADISCVDSCIAIQANNVTLDLNGHTVTYATTNSLAGPRFGVYGIGCNENDATSNNNTTATPCGGNWKSPTIYSSVACTLNGSNQPTACAAQIIQGAGAAGINDAIRFGGTAPSATCSGATLHDFATTETHPSNSQTAQKASASIHFRYCEGPLLIYNILTNNSTAWVQNRTSFEGPDIRLENWTGSSSCEIKNNNLSGGGQGGAFPYQETGCTIHDNLVGTSGHVVQDFAISGYGTNDVVNNNTVNCASCRGIFISGHDFHPPASDNVSVHDNTVTVTMLPQYCPDGGGCPSTASWGCEAHGSYGIQFDDNPTNSVAYNNTVNGTVQNGTNGAGGTESCQVIGLKVTSNNTGDNSHNNTFSVKRASSGVTSKAMAFGTESNTAPVGFSSVDDTFNADSANFFTDWLGAQQAQTFLRPTIGAPASGGILDPNYVTFYFGNGAGSNCNTPSVCPVHWKLTDPTFNGSATRDSHNMKDYTSGGSVGPAEYFIQFTYKPTINCAIGSGSCTPGQPVSGALVVINDVTPTQVFSNTTDASGHLAAGAGTVLIEFRRSNCATANFGNSCGSNGTVTKYLNTPHSVTISKALCTTISAHAVDLTGVTLASAILTETINLTCP